MSKKGMVPHEAYNGQWIIRRREEKKGTRNRYQKQKHNIRTTCVSSTTKKNRNRTRGITIPLSQPIMSS